MWNSTYRSGLAAALVLVGMANASAQDIEQQVRRTRNGTVDLIFASKPGVCGDGHSFISMARTEDGKRTTFRYTRTGFNTTTGSEEYEYRECGEGPVRATLVVEDGEVVDVRTNVGGRALRPNVSVQVATDYLLDHAEHAATANSGKHAILPALLADSVDVSSRLLQIGNNRDTHREIRKSAIFWLGQSAGPAAVSDLRRLVQDEDDEVAKSATFALSQVGNDESVRALLNAARNDRLSMEVRKSAIFWLSQAAGEKATAGLKDLLSDEDAEVKKQAVFALSQIKSPQSVDALIDVVRTSKDPEVRKSALFWLGQSKDPRVLALFEEILLKK